MYIVYAASLSQFVTLLPHANAAPGPARTRMCCAVNATSLCLVCINHFCPCGIVHWCHLDPLATLFAGWLHSFLCSFYRLTTHHFPKIQHFIFINNSLPSSTLQTICYLRCHEAPWGSSGRLRRQTPQESLPPPPGSSDPVCPTRGGSAWPLHAPPPGPGPAAPNVPSAAGSQTGDIRRVGV